MHAIAAFGLRKAFKQTVAVDGIDLVVEQGDVVGLLGPNGAGKTTTLMMLLGITTPDAGEITMLGHRFPHGRTAAIERTNFWASYLGMPGRLTVAEILEIHADLYGAPKRNIGTCVERFGIGHLLARYPREMSSGQKTIVGLARALVNDPDLLVLDEPTASLDPEVADRLRRALADAYAERGFTMLITSHNMTDIERLCRRVVFVGAGRVWADDAPAELAARYGTENLEATFLHIAEEVRR